MIPSFDSLSNSFSFSGLDSIDGGSIGIIGFLSLGLITVENSKIVDS